MNRWCIVMILGLLIAGNCWADREATKDERAASDKLLIQTNQVKRIAAAIKKHLPWGLPVSTAGTSHTHLLCQEDYIIAYDDDKRAAVWSAYRLRREDVQVDRDRISGFRRDLRLSDEAAATLADYDNSGYDRGHMAPSDSFPQTVASMVSTYILSNMTPQKGELNRDVWKWLEGQERAMCVKFGRVWIVTGAVYGTVLVDKINGRVAIPTAYYKIIVHKTGLTSEDITAFVVPHNDPTRALVSNAEYLQSHTFTLENVEAVSELDWFPKLNGKQ